MLNKKQKEFLYDELQMLNELEKWAGDNGQCRKVEEYAIRHHQTYMLLDCLLEIEGKEMYINDNH